MSRLTRFAPYLIIAAATALVFGQAVGFEFVKWDDTLLIVQNPYFRPLSARSLAELLQSAFGGLYMPTTYAYWAALSAASGAIEGSAGPSFDPRLYHGANLLLHAGCGMLVFAIAARLGLPRWAACLGALLFLVHPLQVESVCWVTESKGLLSSLFSLSALYLMTPAGTAGQPRAPAWPKQILALACFLVALGAKPSAVSLPLAVGAMQWIAARRPLTEVLLGLTPWLALAAYWVFVTRGAQPTATSAPHVELIDRPLVAGDALAFYLVKLVWPWPVAIDYGRLPAVALAGRFALVAWIVPVVVAVAAWLVMRHAAARVGLVIVFGSLLPVTGLIPFQFQRVSTVADRYMYIPLVGVALIAATVIGTAGRVAAALGAALVVVLGALSARDAGYWHDDVTLFTRALEVNPQSCSALVNLGATWLERGQPEAAERSYDEALRLDPLRQAAYRGKLRLLIDRGQYADALAMYERALQLNDQLDWAHSGAGAALHHLGNTRQAREHYRRALQPDPRDNSTNLTTYERANVTNRLARILATDRDDALRDGRQAVELARELGRISRYQVAQYLDTIAAAYAESGDFDNAVKFARLAVRRAAAAGNDERARRFESHVRQFEKHKPLRESPTEQLSQ